MDKYEKTIELEEFIQVIEPIVNALNVNEKAHLFKRDKKVQKVAPHVLKHSDEVRGHKVNVYERSMNAKLETEAKVDQKRKEMEDSKLALCTFKPSLIQRKKKGVKVR